MLRVNAFGRSEPANIILWLLLNVADWGVTMTVMREGVGSEGNPIIAWLNPGMFLVYKLLVPLAVLFCLYKWDKLRLLKPLNIVMGIIVLWGVLWLVI